jgi:ABC-type multidrug transport system ATPase subunit
MAASPDDRSASTSAEAVLVEAVVKRFGQTKALDGVSFSVKKGELFGFIGPDGGGKTTLFRILATLLVPDGGTVRVLGIDVVPGLWALRPRIGYMPGRFSLYPDLSVQENLRFFASVFGTTIDREYEQIAPIYRQLEPFKDRRAAALSGGMKQKLALCCALVHRPDILLLDEPTTGVDAVSRREFWDLLAEFKRSGLTTLVSTPYMDEANRCDRVALIQHGRLLAVDTPDAISRSFEWPLFAIQSDQRYRTLLAVRTYQNTRTVYPFGDVLHYTDNRTGTPRGQIEQELRTFLEGQGVHVFGIEPIQATVEDTFMARMGAPDQEHAA